jgi:hypothetical protein
MNMRIPSDQVTALERSGLSVPLGQISLLLALKPRIVDISFPAE